MSQQTEIEKLHEIDKIIQRVAKCRDLYVAWRKNYVYPGLFCGSFDYHGEEFIYKIKIIMDMGYFPLFAVEIKKSHASPCPIASQITGDLEDDVYDDINFLFKVFLNKVSIKKVA